MSNYSFTWPRKEVVMDLEALSKNITIDTTASQEIAELCNKLLDIQKEVAALEDKLKKKKEEELKLSEQDIPNLMQKTGVSLLKLTDGSSVEIKPYYGARIPASRTEEAFGWLRGSCYQCIPLMLERLCFILKFHLIPSIYFFLDDVKLLDYMASRRSLWT